MAVDSGTLARRALPHLADTLHPHDLRHTCATLALDAGEDQPPWTRHAPKHATRKLSCDYIDSLEEPSSGNPEYLKLVENIRWRCGAEAHRIGIVRPAFHAETARYVDELLQENRTAFEEREQAQHLIVNWEKWDAMVKQRHAASGARALALDTDDVATITGYLHDAGQIFHLRDRRSDAVLIDQQWASSLIYEMLQPSGKLAWLIKDRYGRFYESDLVKCSAAWRELDNDLKRGRILQYMRDCGIVARLATRDEHREGEEVYLATEKWLLPAFDAVEQEITQQIQHISELTRGSSRETFPFGSQTTSEFEFRKLMAHLGGMAGVHTQWFRDGMQAVDDKFRPTWCFQVRWRPNEVDGFLGTLDARLIASQDRLKWLAQQVNELLDGEASPLAGRAHGRGRVSHVGSREFLDFTASFFRRERWLRARKTQWDIVVSSNGQDQQAAKALVKALEQALGPEALVGWYQSPHTRSDNVREVMLFMDEMGRTPCILLYLSDSYLEDNPSDNWYCLYELADAINKIERRERAVEQTLVVYAKGGTLNSKNLEVRALTVLSSMANAFADRWRAAEHKPQSAYLLRWAEKLAEATVGRTFFERRGTRGTYSRIRHDSRGAADYSAVIADVQTALKHQPRS